MNNQNSPSAKKFFEVKSKLECAYPKRGKVLEVPELDIYPGEIVVIIGNSGAGKSTLIETLGLMTDTLSSNRMNVGKGEISFFPTDSPDDEVKIPEIWNKGTNGNSVQKIRRENFNFIFQDNNLMHNLKNDENVILADLIDGNLTLKESKDRTTKTFVALHISSSVGENFPTSISGGEKQRIAFARGIQPNFRILFGDEPTGNLDEENAENLMRYLQEQIPPNSKNKAAIIVSHNIDLSLKFADRIIVLTKAAINGYYELLPEYVFTRKSRDTFVWQGKFPLNSSLSYDETKNFPNEVSTNNFIDCKTSLADLKKFTFDDIPSLSEKIEQTDGNQDIVNIKCLKSYIKYILKKNVENTIIDYPEEKISASTAVKIIACIGMALMSVAKWFAKTFNREKYLYSLNINEYFSRLLFQKEGAQLAGNRNSSIKFLFFSIFITFIIIGLANGQLFELKNELMKDPFTLTLEVMHRGGKIQNDTREILNEILANQETMDYYKLDQISEFDRNYLTFYHFNDFSKDQFYIGRSMRFDDPTIEKILDKSINPNRIGRGFNSANDIGLIVTINLLNDLGYDINSPVIYCKVYDIESEQYLNVALPVIAVVDQLPGGNKNYFLYTPNFYDYYRDESIAFPYGVNRNIKIAARISSNKIEELKQVIEGGLNELIDKNIPNYSGFRKLEVDTNYNFREEIYEFIIYPQTSNRNLFEQKQLVSELLKLSSVEDYLANNDLIAGQDIFQVYYFDIPSAADESVLGSFSDRERGYISFLFKEPSMTKEFATMFTRRTQLIDEDKHEGLSLDIGKVESMFIFSKISSLTYSILILLIIIIVFANMQYVYNLLNMHLYKIRRNVGTLMAFGINISTNYKFLMFSFIIYCFILSFVFANIVGYLVLDCLFNYTFYLYSNFRYLDIYITLGAILLIFSGAYFVYFIAEYSYFRKTPSQLIYNRISNNLWRDFFRRFLKPHNVHNNEK